MVGVCETDNPRCLLMSSLLFFSLISPVLTVVGVVESGDEGIDWRDSVKPKDRKVCGPKVRRVGKTKNGGQIIKEKKQLHQK